MAVKNMQTVVGGHRGDCLRACITSVMGVPNPSGFPNPHGKNWWGVWHKFLGDKGLYLSFTQSCWIQGFWIASVPSLNFEGSTHAIVMHDYTVWHDPSPKKTYEVGRNMLGTKLVDGGYVFIVNDFSLLGKPE